MVTASNQLDVPIVIRWQINNQEYLLQVEPRSSINSHEILLYGDRIQRQLRFYGNKKDGELIYINNNKAVDVLIQQPVKHVFLLVKKGKYMRDVFENLYILQVFSRPLLQNYLRTKGTFLYVNGGHIICYL